MGLPPTPEQLHDFEQQADENFQRATENLIDELLDQASFGEKWARHWMDWVRYAESHGSEGDPKIDNAYHYRDYLIRALNADVPYSQLLREHIAGDLLDSPRHHPEKGFNESVIGAAQWRMCFHGFAPTDALDEKVRFTDDQINTFTKAFLGLTVSCARCHNHKFDAISQADYYALFGILGSTRPGRKLLETPAQLQHNKQEISVLKPRIRQAIADHWTGQLDNVKTALLNKEKWKTQKPQPTSIFHPFQLIHKGSKPVEAAARINSLAQKETTIEQAKKHFDLTDPQVAESWYRYGNGVSKQPVKAGDFYIAPDKGRVISTIVPSGMYSGLLSTKHAGRFTSPDFKLQGNTTLMLLVNGGGNALNRYVVQNYPRRGTVYKTDVFAKDQNWKWKSYNLDYWKGDDIHIELATARDTAVLVSPNERSWFGIRQAVLVESGSPVPHNPEQEFWRAVTVGKPVTAEELAQQMIKSFAEAIKAWREDNTNDAGALLLDQLLRENLLPNQNDRLPPGVAKLVDQYRKLDAEIVVPTRIPGMDEWSASDQPLYDRGDHKKPLEPVNRRFLEAVDPAPYQTDISGRLQLAEDLLRPDNPFTRRVIVNRIWTHLFGNGIVRSVDNFGRLGETPTHPQLLDYLASRFDDEWQWSLKTLIREIVSSNTWQQAGRPSVSAQQQDPGNQLLSHYPVRRLEAEAIRDKLLAISGTMDKTHYGPSVPGSAPRRSVYVNVIRNLLDPFLGVFDAPIPFSTVGKRPATNVPAQSLTLLNDPVIGRYASAFARRFQELPDHDRITRMWQASLGRRPTEKELTASIEFISALDKQNQLTLKQKRILGDELGQLTSEINDITEPVRQKLEGEQHDGNQPTLKIRPVVAWDFAQGKQELIEGLEGRLTGNAKITNGSLYLDGSSSYMSAPLPFDLKEKTLVVTLQLNRLDQRGGGAITVQDTRGILFDSIVFAERKNGEWLSGSNYHKRTRDFGGPAEKEANSGPVQIAITYDETGKICGYRNGEPYGTCYDSSGPTIFRKNQSQVTLGLRHGTSNGGNRNLSATIYSASVYDQALNAESIKALASGQNYISRDTVMSHLSAGEKERLEANERRIEQIRNTLDRPEFNISDKWESFARSLFNLKEFIYYN